MNKVTVFYNVVFLYSYFLAINWKTLLYHYAICTMYVCPISLGNNQIIKMEIYDGFSIRGGGLEFHIPILKNDFFENHLESLSQRVLH